MSQWDSCEARAWAGKGLAVATGLDFKFEDGDPAGNWLKSAILSYAAGHEFEPQQSISPEQLMSVLEAPIVTGSADTNRANDTNAN